MKNYIYNQNSSLHFVDIFMNLNEYILPNQNQLV